jgi:putative DNA primase/helicase
MIEPQSHVNGQAPGRYKNGVDLEEAERFLKLLDPCASCFTFQTFDDDKTRKAQSLVRILHGALDDVSIELVALNGERAGIFVTVNETDGRGRKRENIIRLRAVWCEQDDAAPRQWPIPASIVNQTSPGHHHYYWLFDGELSNEAFAMIMCCLVEVYGSDKQATDISRVLRLPGFYHCKPERGAPSLVRIVEASGHRYTAAEVVAAFQPKPKSKATHKANEHTEARYGSADERSDAEVCEALSYIPAHDRQVWLDVGMALHHWSGGSSVGFDTWKNWSEGAEEKFDEPDQERVWRSFKGKGKTISTVFSLAGENGADLSDLARRHRVRSNGHDHSPDGGANQTDKEAGAEDATPDMSVIAEYRLRLAPAVLDLEPFGNLAAWIAASAAACSVPVDYVAVSLLAAVAGLVGPTRWVSPWSGWIEPLILWCALVGNPSAGKSPSLDTVAGPLADLETWLTTDFNRVLQRHEAEKLAAKLRRDAWEEEVQKALKKGGDPPAMPDNASEPEAPSRPRALICDATVEAVAVVLSQQPRGVLKKRDELAGWIGNMSKYGGEGDRGFWLECFGGRPYVVDRKKQARPLCLRFTAISILGGFQPERLNSVLMIGDDDGLFSRFLFTWPNPVPPKRPTNAPNREQIDKVFRRLRRLDYIRNGEDLRPVTIPLTEQAATAFEEWRQEHFVEAKETSGLLGSAMGKMPGFALRLAGVLELLAWAARDDNPEQPENVTATSLGYALHLLEGHFKPMMQRVLGEAVRPAVERHAAMLAREILARRVAVVNARDVQRTWKLPGPNDAAHIGAALNELIEARWLYEAPTREGKTKGRQRRDYATNPLLWKQNP